MTVSVVANFAGGRILWDEEGTQKLVPRYDKCLSNGGEYVENSLKNVESDNNKILYEIVFDSFLQQNGTYFLNKPRKYSTR